MDSLDRMTDAASFDPRTLTLLRQVLDPSLPPTRIPVITKDEQVIKEAKPLLLALDRSLPEDDLYGVIERASSFIPPLEAARFLLWTVKVQDPKDTKYRGARERGRAGVQALKIIAREGLAATAGDLQRAFRESYELPLDWALSLEVAQGEDRHGGPQGLSEGPASSQVSHLRGSTL